MKLSCTLLTVIICFLRAGGDQKGLYTSLVLNADTDPLYLPSVSGSRKWADGCVAWRLVSVLLCGVSVRGPSGGLVTGLTAVRWEMCMTCGFKDG